MHDRRHQQRGAVDRARAVGGGGAGVRHERSSGHGFHDVGPWSSMRLGSAAGAVKHLTQIEACQYRRRFDVHQPDAALRGALGGRHGHPGQGLAQADDRDRRRVHGRPRARAVPQGRAAGGGQHRVPRPRLRPGAGREGAARVRRAGAQSRTQHPHRRELDGVRRGLRAAVRPSGRGPPRRDHGRLPELHQAGPDLSGPRLRGRRHLRAQRHAARQPPPRHDLRAADADRQGLHGQRGVGRQRRGHPRDELDPVRLREAIERRRRRSR